MMTTIRRFYNKYRNNLELNKNLMLSGTAAFFVSAAVTELYSKYNNNDFWISIVSILTGFSISVPLFAFLFYMDDKRSRKDKSFQNLIIKKLGALYSISNIVNVLARFVIIFELLKLEVQPYEASMLSSLCASGLSYFITNLASKAFKGFRSRNKINTMARICSSSFSLERLRFCHTVGIDIIATNPWTVATTLGN